MTSRSRREIIVFNHPFRIRSIGRDLAAGSYDVVTDEDMIEGISFASYRRVATMMVVPAEAARNGAMEMIAVDPADIADARARDARHD